MNSILKSLRNQLIVSCQAYPDDPMEHTETLRRVARSAILGGAKGIRLNSAEHALTVRQDTSLPIIAIEKSYEGGALRITPTFAAAASLAAAGASIIALDCTDREHTYGEPWREIVRRIHDELGLLVMADIATLHDGILAAEAGVDIVAPTLHGYTEETKNTLGFHPELISSLATATGIPVIAEGNVSTPELARIALEAGAWCVVAGSAITRPGTIAASFIREMAKASTEVETPRYAIGIDIGGTAIKAAIVDSKGEILHPLDVPTLASEGRDRIAASLQQAVQKILAVADNDKLELCGIGVASAGVIDSRTGTVFAATDNLPGWTGFDIRDSLSSLTLLPIFAENDAHAAALAEIRFGQAQKFSNILAVTLGTGIGGGITNNGQLLRGHRGFAGTIGHQTIRFDGRPCNCGRRGCLEAYVSTAALLLEYQGLLPENAAPSQEPPTAQEIVRLACAGDPTALEAYRVLAGYLAEGLANACNLLDPDAIVLSGGLLEGQKEFAQEVLGRVQKLLHFGTKRTPQIFITATGRYTGAQGAAASVFDQLLPARG